MNAKRILTKRTDDPKLGWIERKLTEARIECARDGFSFHAPILVVSPEDWDAAWAIVEPVDDIPDDDRVFVDDAGGCSCGPASDGAEAQCAFCAVDEAVEAARSGGRTT